MELKVTKSQALKNRQYIKELWKKVKPAWVDLNEYLVSLDPQLEDCDDEELAIKCDGKNGPTNTCGAVGCFAGWNWTSYHYQQWCRRNSLDIANTDNLNVWLGLEAGSNHFWEPRMHPTMTQHQEVKDRLKALLKMPVYTETQSVCQRSEL